MEFRKLRADEIDVRIAQITKYSVMLLLYKDARCDMNILDEIVGCMNWKREHTRDNANCIVSIWDDTKNMWISKEDTGTESFTEKEKSLASDSFKRACFNWGIGRELYTAPDIRFKISDCKVTDGKCYDKFTVKAIDYDGNVISKLWIENETTHAQWKYGFKDGEVIQEDEAEQLISEQEYYKLQETIARYDACNEQPLNQQKMKEYFNVESFMTLKKVQFVVFMKQLEAKIS